MNVVYSKLLNMAIDRTILKAFPPLIFHDGCWYCGKERKRWYKEAFCDKTCYQIYKLTE